MTTLDVPVRPGRTLEYPFSDRPETGATIEIRPGIHWVRMRLPMQLNHINLGWLVRRFDVELWISRTEYLMCRNLAADTGLEAPAEGLRFYRAAGYPEDFLEGYKARFGGFGHGVYKLPNAFKRISEGDDIVIGGRVWRVVSGNGHSPEHSCLWCAEEGVFISGDQILPRISSNVSVHPTEPEANSLQDWLDSCSKLKAIVPDGTLVLPSHNEPFHGASVRLQELIDMHELNMEKLYALCAEPKRATDCFPALFRSRITQGNYMMATGESLAHLNCLKARGRVVRNEDKNGINWYESL